MIIFIQFHTCVQKNDSGSSQQLYSSPLWVSHNRNSFRQARFPLEMEEKVK